MRFAAPIDMAKKPDDEKEEATEIPAKSNAPMYYWRHCFSLDGEDLEKLGMEMPEQGEMVNFIITGKVTSRTESEYAGPDGNVTKNRCVEIQITSFRPEVDEVTEIEESTKARRGRFYDKTDSDAA